MVKERPMLFSTPMVRAILENRKTQTRRIIKPQPEVNEHGNLCGEWIDKPLAGLLLHKPQDIVIHCPYGKIGDRLWVRETWRIWTSSKQPAGDVNDPEIYTASIKKLNDESIKSLPIEYKATSMDDGPWRPSIFMHRWASRILLEITDIRVDRLQDISEEDAIAEGIKQMVAETCNGEPVNDNYVIDDYAHLWEKINGKGSWDLNPYVWVVSFRRI